MVDILAFGAHPDDIEFGCGGVLVKMASLGKSIVMVDLTLGEKASHGTPEERRKEALAASAVIGAERVFLNFSCCEVFDTYEGRLELVKVLRHYRPCLVLAPLCDEGPNHPDHIACGLMARYACRYSRFKNILPDIPTHTPEGILHYLYPFCECADFLVDITNEVDTWVAMMKCHESQHKTQNYTDANLRLASRLGLLIGTEYAQGFRKNNPIVVEDILSIAKGTVEL